MTSKAYYRNYLADNNISELSIFISELIELENPQSVFEFGCGTGKNLKLLDPIVTCGLDISPQNITVAHYKNERNFVIIGDESHLGHLDGFDVAFTCSVLDHIEYITEIIKELKRIGKTVFLAEADRHDPDTYYWSHDYESFGFEKLDYGWVGEDGATYNIWKWENIPKNND